MADPSNTKAKRSRSTGGIPSFGFIGLMASGKSTYGDHLAKQMEERLGVKTYRFTFSDKIAEIATDLFDMKEKDRALLQAIGAKMKEIRKPIWAEYIARIAKRDNKLPFIVDGIRSKDEAEAMRQAFPGFLVIKLEADEKLRLEAYKRKFGRYPTKEESNNITEATIADITPDIVIHNLYKWDELEKQIGDIITAIETNTMDRLLKHAN